MYQSNKKFINVHEAIKYMCTLGPAHFDDVIVSDFIHVNVLLWVISKCIVFKFIVASQRPIIVQYSFTPFIWVWNDAFAYFKTFFSIMIRVSQKRFSVENTGDGYDPV